MKKTALCLVALCLVGCVGPHPRSAAESGVVVGRTEAIHAAVADWLEHWPDTEHVNQLSSLAERIVDRLAAGGRFYVAGDPGFCDEMDNRAGGFAAVVPWDALTRMTTNDVLLVGWFESAGKASRQFNPAFLGKRNGRFTQALTVVVASRRWPLAGVTRAIAGTDRWPGGLEWLDTGVPPTVDPCDYAVGQIATIAAGYALEGEMIAAAARRHRTLAFYTSMFEPGSKPFNDAAKGRTFLEAPRLEPIPAGVLARAYFAVCGGQVRAFAASDQPAQVRRAAARLAGCQRRGGTVLAVMWGHVLQRGATVPPALWSVAPYAVGWAWTAPEGLRPGDVLCAFGYLDFPRSDVEAATKAGAETVTLSVAGGVDTPTGTHIRAAWKPWDGCVPVPGYPYRVLPSSGIVMSAVWYSLMDESLQLLDRQDGDEKILYPNRNPLSLRGL